MTLKDRRAAILTHPVPKRRVGGCDTSPRQALAQLNIFIRNIKSKILNAKIEHRPHQHFQL
ncbi:hypothetical protein [Microcoleus sp. herbarium12]|uniref:hypothetical protein n=1 Tax=Microcoleus sp. herbarium12 TaxID=3055437 RepID=UPI002FD3F8BC